MTAHAEVLYAEKFTIPRKVNFASRGQENNDGDNGVRIIEDR
jgi:hypothetical protein